MNSEAESILNISGQLDQSFNDAVDVILDTPGKVIVSGMGKSGHVGNKIAATLSSTGTSSFFVHPAEAIHGDLGMIAKEDVILLISFSGETDEVLKMLVYAKNEGIKTISITGNTESSLARNSDVPIVLNVEREACPLELAPTNSTTVTLALGDAMAVALMKARDFQSEDFARFHPGGSLGRKLLTKVSDVMRVNSLPFADEDTSLASLLIKMSEGMLGMAIIGTRDNVRGIITDGDIRRALVKDSENFDMKSSMTSTPQFVDGGDSVGKIEALMKEKKITTVLVGRRDSLEGVYQIFNA